jgi:hypothetical protein
VVDDAQSGDLQVQTGTPTGPAAAPRCPFAGKPTAALAGFDDEAEWCRAVLAGLSSPKVEVDSFVLHAPLELLARAYLLPFVRKEVRAEARTQMAAVLERYQAAGEDVGPPPDRAFGDAEDAAYALGTAIDEGDVQEADAVAAWLEPRVTPAQIQYLLGDQWLDRLGAEGHATVYLSLLGRTSFGYGLTWCPGLRGFARELARERSLRITWCTADTDADSTGSPTGRRGVDMEGLVQALRAIEPAGGVPMVGVSSIMHRFDASGLGPRALLAHLASDGVDAYTTLRPAFNAILRVAATAMLVESDDAEYGWTHCLTLPQAASRLAVVSEQPLVALRVAATYVGGFRAALGTGALPADYEPEPVVYDFPEALRTSPTASAAAAWHTPPAERNDIVTELVTEACLRDDAHLVKYTLACLDAAQADREASSLYFAAAAHLAARRVCEDPERTAVFAR